MWGEDPAERKAPALQSQGRHRVVLVQVLGGSWVEAWEVALIGSDEGPGDEGRWC